MTRVRPFQPGQRKTPPGNSVYMRISHPDDGQSGEIEKLENFSQTRNSADYKTMEVELLSFCRRFDPLRPSSTHEKKVKVPTTVKDTETTRKFQNGMHFHLFARRFQFTALPDVRSCLRARFSPRNLPPIKWRWPGCATKSPRKSHFWRFSVDLNSSRTRVQVQTTPRTQFVFIFCWGLKTGTTFVKNSNKISSAKKDAPPPHEKFRRECEQVDVDSINDRLEARRWLVDGWTAITALQEIFKRFLPHLKRTTHFSQAKYTFINGKIGQDNSQLARYGKLHKKLMKILAINQNTSQPINVRLLSTCDLCAIYSLSNLLFSQVPRQSEMAIEPYKLEEDEKYGKKIPLFGKCKQELTFDGLRTWKIPWGRTHERCTLSHNYFTCNSTRQMPQLRFVSATKCHRSTAHIRATTVCAKSDCVKTRQIDKFHVCNRRATAIRSNLKLMILYGP